MITTSHTELQPPFLHMVQPRLHFYFYLSQPLASHGQPAIATPH
jgi:hypothetical protein